MNRLTIDKRKQVLASLVEGNSIRATVRMTGTAKNTVTKLLVDVGQACLDYAGWRSPKSALQADAGR